MASKERPAKGHREEHSPLNKLIDKAQGRRRGAGSPDTIDKVIDKAQESGLTDKLAQRARERFSGRSGRKRWRISPPPARASGGADERDRGSAEDLGPL